LGSLIPLRGPSSRRGRDLRVVGVFGVADLAFDLGTGAGASRFMSTRPKQVLPWQLVQNSFVDSAEKNFFARSDAAIAQVRRD